MKLPRLEQVAAWSLAMVAAGTLATDHWLQMPDPALTAMVGLLGGAVTLYFVNSHRPPTIGSL